MIIKFLKLTSLILILTFVTGCKTTESTVTENQEPNILEIFGNYDDGKYINNYYGFELNIPNTYIIHDDETKNRVMELGVKILDTDDESALRIAEIAAEQTYNILMSSKFEFGAPVRENIIFQIISENLRYQPGVKNGADYFWHVQKLLKDSGVILNSESEIIIEEINGTEFYTYGYEMSIQNNIINQKWYCKKIGDHMLCIALTYISEQGYNELKDIINTLEFFPKNTK